MLWLPVIFLLGAMLAPLGELSYSAATTVISVDPLMFFAEPGEQFTVDVIIVGGVDVFAWQLNMSYDTSVLRFINGTLPPDHFLLGRPDGTSQLFMYELGDSVLMSCTIIGEYLGIHGSGTLVTLEFEVLARGESVLKFDDTPGETLLLDNLLVETNPGPDLRTDDGYFSNLDLPPVADFTHSPTVPDANVTVTFDATLSNDPDGAIVRYEWDFGDGTYANVTSATTTHVFTQTQIYTVTLVVFDNASVTQEMQDAFNTTTVPRVWYELYSSFSREIALGIDHDIAITGVDASPRTVTTGDPVTLSVIVENQGQETETFSLTVYYDDSTAATTTVENLASGETKTVQLTWDTTDVPLDSYIIRAEAILEGDQDPGDNIFQDGTVRVQQPEAPFPIEYAAIGAVVIVVIIIAIYFLFIRKRGTPAT